MQLPSSDSPSDEIPHPSQTLSLGNIPTSGSQRCSSLGVSVVPLGTFQKINQSSPSEPIEGQQRGLTVRTLKQSKLPVQGAFHPPQCIPHVYCASFVATKHREMATKQILPSGDRAGKSIPAPAPPVWIPQGFDLNRSGGNCC